MIQALKQPQLGWDHPVLNAKAYKYRCSQPRQSALNKIMAPMLFTIVCRYCLTDHCRKRARFQRSEIINQVCKRRNMSHFLQKKRTLGKWLMPKLFIYTTYSHQQGSNTVKQHRAPLFRTGDQLLGLDYSLCPPCSLFSAPKVVQKKFLDGLELAVVINS